MANKHTRTIIIVLETHSKSNMGLDVMEKTLRRAVRIMNEFRQCYFVAIARFSGRIGEKTEEEIAQFCKTEHLRECVNKLDFTQGKKDATL